MHERSRVRTDERAEIANLEAVAEVGLVDAVAVHRLAP